MRLAGWTYSYDRMPIEESIAHIAATGYDGFALATGDSFSTPIDALDDALVDRVRGLAHQHALQPVAVSALWRLATPTEAEWETEWAKWRRSIEVAARLGAPFVDCGSGVAPPGWSRQQLWSALRRNARRIADYAADHGVVVTIEPHWGAAVERPGDVLELLAVVNKPSFRVNLDVCHPFALGYDLESIAAMLAPHMAYAHVCDVRGRHPGGPGQPGHQLVNPGEGEIDWPRWLGLLHRHGYYGWLGVQISVMRRAWPDYDPKRCMQEVYGVLIEAMRRAKVPRT